MLKVLHCFQTKLFKDFLRQLTVTDYISKEFIYDQKSQRSISSTILRFLSKICLLMILQSIKV